MIQKMKEMGYQKGTSHAKTCYFLILCSSSGLAQNGTQLREILSKNTTDILFLDIHFGEENKLELSKKLKEKCGDIRIVIVTADNTKKTIQSVILYKADTFVTKPFLPQHIIISLTS